MVPKRVLEYLDNKRGDMLAFLERLVLAESPSSVPESQAQVQSILLETLQALDYEVQIIQGKKTGGHLLARSQEFVRRDPEQLLLGHCDTVWPLGTLKQMPFETDGEIVRGPGVYDMKGGLTQMLFALQALRDLQLKPNLTPVIFINSDEEIGSLESDQHISKLAQQVKRAFVLEPALGLTGRLKTARKGVGHFEIMITGIAAHAGLDPDKGASAILELSHQIQQLYSLNDRERGISVNVGTVTGGLRSNVVAPSSSASIDVRVPTQREAKRMESAIYELRPITPGVSIEIRGKIGRPPLERTVSNCQLWNLALNIGHEINIHLEEGIAGGASDGNITSQYTATLDGLGAVGDGAHAAHEFVFLEKMSERAALLAMLLLAPLDA
jgi:glutamate carboxypeptidase